MSHSWPSQMLALSMTTVQLRGLETDVPTSEPELRTLRSHQFSTALPALSLSQGRNPSLHSVSMF